MLERRELLIGSLVTTAVLATPACAAPAKRRPDMAARIRTLEVGEARLGVCIFDTATGDYTGNRPDEHFAMCSTFKLLIAAICLREADAGRLDLGERIPFTKTDLVSNSPVTTDQLGAGGMTIGALAEATQKTSDNAAANLLIKRLGGPAAVTAHFRAMGDKETRVDRYEPAMNFVLSADLRDTTTPHAMAGLVARLTTGKLLSPAAQQTLIQWMVDTKTGLRRIRAGLPPEWRAGDKTGTGWGKATTNKYNDIAIFFPPERPPIIAAAFFDTADQNEEAEDRYLAVLADVGRIAADWARSG